MGWRPSFLPKQVRQLGDIDVMRHASSFDRRFIVLCRTGSPFKTLASRVVHHEGLGAFLGPPRRWKNGALVRGTSDFVCVPSALSAYSSDFMGETWA